MTRIPLDITKENRALDHLARPIIWVAGGIGILALLTSFALGFTRDDGGARLASAYFVNLIYFLSLSLGALFFVILHHLVRAGWSVVVRRFAEAIAANLWLLAILFIPILLWMDQIYPWANAEAAAGDHLIEQKRAWLNGTFFLIRCVVYFGIWIVLSQYLKRRSCQQDVSGDPMQSVRMERSSGPAMVLYALTVTFASFDLVMSLDPHWYSTIFGVYVFSGSVLAFLALLSILAMLMQRSGRLTGAITVEHYHDMGKLIFAFTVFWAYIAFSQYMLIWYANIPEETQWFLRRQTGEWTQISLLLLLGHFIVPFVVLLPRFVKRSKPLLAAAAAWVLLMHWLDLYWLITPRAGLDRLQLGILEATCFLGIGGLYLAAATHCLRNRSLLPEKDPRLTESLISESV
jgi:hypothetical protein